MEAKCKTCYHHRAIGYQGTSAACHYCIDTGKLRETAPKDCDKWRSKKQPMHRNADEFEGDT